MEHTNMNSNNQVKQLRLQRAWSREQLAEMAGLSVRTIQRIENGERPGLETLSALAAVFEVTVAEIGGEARRKTRRARSLTGFAHRGSQSAGASGEPLFPFAVGGAGGLRAAGGA